VKKTLKDWFNGLAADFYEGNMWKLVIQYKHLNLHRDFVKDLRPVVMM
jgi:hypothetical protein